MTTDEHVNGDNRYRDALARIAAIAASVTTENGETAEATPTSAAGSRSSAAAAGSAPPRTPEDQPGQRTAAGRRWAARHRSTRSG